MTTVQRSSESARETDLRSKFGLKRQFFVRIEGTAASIRDRFRVDPFGKYFEGGWTLDNLCSEGVALKR